MGGCFRSGLTSAPAGSVGTCPCPLSSPTPSPGAQTLPVSAPFSGKISLNDIRIAMAYSPTFTQTQKTKRSLLVVPIKISESPWLSQSRSQLTPNLIQCAVWYGLSILSLDSGEGALGIPVQIKGLFLKKPGCRLESWGGMTP